MTRHSGQSARFAAIATALLLAGSAQADHHEAAAGAEGTIMVGESVDLKGKVLAIDAKTRTVLIEGEAGRRVEITAPETAANFDQISVGDAVTARYYEAVALSIAPVADATPGATGVASVSTAPPGSTPGGVIAREVQLRAVVTAVDTEARTVTLDVPEGRQRVLKVQEGIDLENVKTGEQVAVTFAQALAISIAPPE